MKETDFYLYFPTEDAARAAGAACEADAESVAVRRAADDVNWLTLVRLNLPDGALDDAEGRFEQLAERHSGEYDGYERTV